MHTAVLTVNDTHDVVYTSVDTDNEAVPMGDDTLTSWMSKGWKVRDITPAGVEGGYSWFVMEYGF